MVAASAQRPAHRCGFSLYTARRAEAIRFSGWHSKWNASDPHAAVDRRGAGILRRPAPSFRTLHSPGGLHSFGDDGGGLLSGPCAEGLLDYTERRERWGAGGVLLLRIPLFVSCRRWTVESGFGLAARQGLIRTIPGAVAIGAAPLHAPMSPGSI